MNGILNKIFFQFCFIQHLIIKAEYIYEDFDIISKGNPSSNSQLNINNSPLTYFPHYDKNGNILGYTDEEDEVVAAYDYSAFGMLSQSGGVMVDDFNIRYSSKYFDTETNLYYYGYRMYDPKLGRWLNREILGEEETLNLYSFVNNNSVNLYDVLGLFGDGINASIAKKFASMKKFRNFKEAVTFGLYKGDSNEVLHKIAVEKIKEAGVLPGHSDMFGGDRFNFTIPDHSFWSHPFNPFGIHDHFKTMDEVTPDLEEAIRKGNRRQFEILMHQGEDTFSHSGKHYTGHWWGFNPVSLLLSSLGVRNTGIGHFGSLFPWNENPDADMDAWEKANKWTKEQVTAWDAARAKEKCPNSK